MNYYYYVLLNVELLNVEQNIQHSTLSLSRSVSLSTTMFHVSPVTVTFYTLHFTHVYTYTTAFSFQLSDTIFRFVTYITTRQHSHQPSAIKHQASSIKHQASSIKHQAASSKQASKQQASSSKHQASSIKRQALKNWAPRL